MRSSNFIFDEQSNLVFHNSNDEDVDIDVNYSEIENQSRRNEKSLAQDPRIWPID
jgi:hypothetical protein